MAVAEVVALFTRVHDHKEASMNEVLFSRIKNLTMEQGRELLCVCSTAPETSALRILAGIYYQDGHLSLRDEKKAIELYGRATDLGNPYAINNLGYCYQEGIGVARDEKKAIELFERAVALGGAPAIFNLGYCYLYGIGVPRDLTKTVELYTRGVDLGDSDAMNGLAHCYEKALGVPRDMMRAVELYGRAVALENPIAMNNLGLCYRNGVGVARDDEKAVELFTRAGTATSLWHLGLYYEHEGKNPQTAIDYMHRAHSLYVKERDKADCREAIDRLFRDRDVQMAVLDMVSGHRKEIETLGTEIERLRAEVEYRPGGMGYMVARDDFMAKCPRRRASI